MALDGKAGEQVVGVRCEKNPSAVFELEALPAMGNEHGKAQPGIVVDLQAGKSWQRTLRWAHRRCTFGKREYVTLGAGTNTR